MASQAVVDVREIAQLAGVNDLNHIHIVPGNHDLDRHDWDKVEKGKTPGLDVVYKEYKKGKFLGKVNSGVDEMSCREYLLSRFDFFFDVADELSNSVWAKSSKTETLHHVRAYDTHKII